MQTAHQATETLIHGPVGFLETEVIRLAKKLTGGDLAREQRALSIFRAIEKDPIFDPHTHYETEQIAKNRKWDNPTQLFLGVPNAKREDGTGIGFDHYAARVMLDCGVPENLVYGRNNSTEPIPTQEFDKLRFRAFVASMEKANGNPSARWFKISLEKVFGISIEIKERNADEIWDKVQSKLEEKEFHPQEMLARHNVQVALTTDGPTDSLSAHALNAKEGRIGPRLLPTFRPDRLLYPELNNRYSPDDFKNLLKEFSSSSGLQPPESLDDFQELIKNRMNFFQGRGCIAMDLGFENYSSAKIDKEAASNVFAKFKNGDKITESDAQDWKAYMMAFLCEQAAAKKWVVYFHQGAARNQNTILRQKHGVDVGGDGPGKPLNQDGFVQLLDHLNNTKVEGSADGSALPKSVFFSMYSTDFGYILDTIGGFKGNNAGIAGKLQLGPPWWMNDYVDENIATLKLIANKSVFSNFIGMLSDARSLPPVIGRIIEFRALLSATLVDLYPDMPEHELTELAHNISNRNCGKFLGLEAENR